MDLTVGPDEEQIVDSARQFVARALPVARLHGAVDPISANLREQIAEMGWHAIALPEELGGLGLSFVEEALVLREIGRGLGPTTILSNMLAAHAAAADGQNDLAQALIAGRASAAILIPRSGSADDAMIYDGEAAICAVAADPDRAILYDMAKLSIEARPCLDKSVTMGRVRLSDDAVIARLAGPVIYRRAALAVAAMQIGISEAVTAMIVDYAKVRVTFGRPIGAYQAVRHCCADMLVRSEASRAQLLYAAVSLRDGLPDADLMLEAAHAVAHDAAIRNVDDNIQLHGGVGITEEHDAHLFMKRAQLLGQWFGTTAITLDRIRAASLAAATSH